jgi:hypothetical protein
LAGFHELLTFLSSEEFFYISTSIEVQLASNFIQ